MDKIVEGTLVRYHGEVRNLRGDLAFIRESEIRNDDRRWYRLDTICYVGDELPWDDDQPITTFGDVWATRGDFTAVDLPEVPELALQFGNYLVHGTPWRKTAEGWYTWANYSERWKSAPDLTDSCARGEMAVFIGPLP